MTITINTTKAASIDAAVTELASFDADPDRLSLEHRLATATPAQLKSYASSLTAAQQKALLGGILLLLKKLL